MDLKVDILQYVEVHKKKHSQEVLSPQVLKFAIMDKDIIQNFNEDIRIDAKNLEEEKMDNKHILHKIRLDNLEKFINGSSEEEPEDSESIETIMKQNQLTIGQKDGIREIDYIFSNN